MNQDHAGALLLLVRAYAGLEADTARMTGVDRLGFDLRLQTGERVHGTRIAFPEEIDTVEKSRSVLVEMTKRAGMILGTT